MTQPDLFDGLAALASGQRKPKKRRSAGWEFTDHACRHCMGRVMRRTNPDGRIVVRCAECGSSVAGDHDSLCWCGVEVRGHGTVFECFRNPTVSITTPQEVLVRERKVDKVVVSDRRSGPAGGRR